MGNSASSSSSTSEKIFTADTYALPPGCSKPILLDKHRFRRKVTSKSKNRNTATDTECECCNETCDCFGLNLNVTKKKFKSKTKSTTKVIIHPIGIQPQPTQQQLQLVNVSCPPPDNMIINVPLYSPVPANGHIVQPVQLDNNAARAPQPGDYNYSAPAAAVQFAPPPPPAGAPTATIPGPLTLPPARFLPPFQAGANYIVGGNLGGQLMMADANPLQLAGYQTPMMVPLGTRVMDVEVPAAAAPQKDLENRVLMLQFSDGTQRYLTSNGQHLRASDYLNRGAFWAPEVGGFVRFTGETAG
ncbi:hypothetical protein EX30DRAFT_342324 [Ascodesmis nigricans]|uniref:Uncharacterized protein n=1 Tax=Ascodesmis nigricans TaxID=341454 RepID=A0A4S2MQE1_9PEZI|nr:hypothetical protein EX30DRAFT_342324 [Ascodesmis nigricans]